MPVPPRMLIQSKGRTWTFRELVTSVFSPPYSRMFAGPEVQSSDQAGYATQLHRPLASTISGPTSQHFLQEYAPRIETTYSGGDNTLYEKVESLSYFCQEMPPAILKMGRYSEMRTHPIMPPTTIISRGLMALVRLSVAESTSAW